MLIHNIQLVPIFVVVVVVAYFLPDVERFLQRATGLKYRNKLEHLLDQAGNWKENDYFSLIRRKIIFALNSFVVSYLYLIAKDKSYVSLVFSIFAIFMGFFIPDILLQNRVLKRKEMLADTLPDAIDMLQMCVSAGLAFPAALSKVAETQNGPVAEEFARVTAEVQLGQSRSEALAAMSERTQEEHIQKFVSAMMQVDRFGIPVGNVLIEQSKEMRSARRERARERGQKVPVKILAPIMLCFLPTVLMIILGPAVISIMRAFSGQ
ncbi:MAG: type II secretion system F family protein [Ferruginibacter sp.]